MLDLIAKWLHEGTRKNGAAIAIPLSRPDRELVRREIDVVNAQSHPFEKPKAGSVQEARDQLIGSRHAFEQARDLVAGKYDGKPTWTACTHE